MLKVLLILYYLLFILTFIYCFYFIVTGVFGILKKSKIKFKKALVNNHFAILIAARNEEAVISNLIESLKKQNYPDNAYDIYVIPNNCTDNTKKVAASTGAKIIDCTVETKTKGDVLKFVFDKFHDNKKIDAYIIFDADNVVHPNFLANMNDALESGYRVAEGFRDAKNPSDNWLSGSYTIFYLFQNIFFNRARMALNGSSSINGTGFMIKKELIDEEGFETFTLTEDVEYTGQCALKGEKIVFVEDAITYDEYPVSFSASWKQRKRWSAGILECFKRYSGKLFKRFLKTGDIAALDMSLVYGGPIILVLNYINALIFLIICLNNVFKISFLFSVSIYLVNIIIYVFMLSFKKKKVSEVISGILLFPLFIITWIPINIICMLKKHTKWEEIKHNRVVGINDVMKK
jgi:cellulose synthase/poly-beta-1,6-N-acetylglucosamine synthase-like glycosyltransferase